MLVNVYMYIAFIWLSRVFPTSIIWKHHPCGCGDLDILIRYLMVGIRTKRSPIWSPIFVATWRPQISGNSRPGERFLPTNGEDVTLYWSIVLPHGDMKRNATKGWGDESGWRFLFPKIFGATSPKSVGFELSFYRFFFVFCCGRCLYVERFWVGSKDESLLNARIRIYCQILEW